MGKNTKKFNRFRYVVLRDSADETTMAIVDATVMTDNRYLSACEFVEQYLKPSLTEWVKKTKQGQTAWKESCDDFNVGDLSMCCDNKALTKILAEHGVINMEVDTVSETAVDDWDYDTVLVDASEVEE